jgi:phosphoglycolate phosphatase-like HAD superfamily hydrolase
MPKALDLQPEKAGEIMRLHGMLFDLDGTLGDTIPVCIQAFQRTFHHYLGHLLTAQDIIAMFGPGEEGLLQRHLPQAWPQALDLYLEEYARAHVTCREPFPGIFPLLTTLQRRGVRLGIVTGRCLQSASISVHALGLDVYFDRIEAAAGGPVKPAGIRAFLTRWVVAPEEVAYVGDEPYDIDAAKHAGVMAVAAAWAASADAAALVARQPHVLFRSVAEFATWAEHVAQ